VWLLLLLLLLYRSTLHAAHAHRIYSTLQLPKLLRLWVLLLGCLLLPECLFLTPQHSGQLPVAAAAIAAGAAAKACIAAAQDAAAAVARQGWC
jgi:uncharacterized membrane protein